MQPRLNCFQIAAELLIYTLVALGNYLIRIVDEATTDTRHPSPHESTAFSPSDHALAVHRDFSSRNITLGQVNMLRLPIQSLAFLDHLFSVFDFSIFCLFFINLFINDFSKLYHFISYRNVI